MKYVLIRDDDTNAFTPPACLERLYRPFLNRGLPVNLATIPAVRTDVRSTMHQPEGFLFGNSTRRADPEARAVPIGENAALVEYLRANSLLHIIQHGFHHDWHEFEQIGRREATHRLEEGTRLLQEAGFQKPAAFVAPHDKFSRGNYWEVARRFPIVSTGWFELCRLPCAWWPRYALRKLLRRAHWHAGNGSLLLSHPGCLLSRFRPQNTILENVRATIDSRRVTVLVTHWWEYFPDETADEAFIAILHETADFLASRRDIRVLKFEDLLAGDISLN